MSSRATPTPAVSVIVPTCRRVGRLGRALRSIQAQTWRDWDCWVVRDGDDDAAAVASLLEGLADERFRLIRNGAGGASAGRNAGIERSCGGIVAFLDDDDAWLPRHLEGHVGLHRDAEPGAVYSDAILVWEDDELPPLLLGPNRLPGDPFAELRAGRFMADGASTLSVSRRCLEALGGFDVELHCMEDYDMVCRLASRFPLRHLEEHAVFYVQHADPRLSTDLDLMTSDLRILAQRWGTPERTMRLWVRDRVCLQAMVAAARSGTVGARLRALLQYGDTARPAGVGRGGWTLQGMRTRPRDFARLVLLALFGLGFHRLRRRFGSGDAEAARLVSEHLPPVAVAG